MRARVAQLATLVAALAAVGPAAGQPRLADGRAAVRLDQLGDPLPEGAVARLGTARLHDGYVVSSLAFTPDGKRILSTSNSGTARVWSAETGGRLGDYTNGHDVARSVEVTADGRRIVIGGAFTDAAYTLDEASGELLHHLGDLPNHGESRACDPEWEVRAVALSPDGRLGALPALPEETHWSSFGDHPAIRLFRIEDGREVGRLFGEGPRNRFVTARFSPDGKLVAAGDRAGCVTVWELNSLQPVFVGKVHRKGVFALSFSPDSRTLASAGREGIVALQDARDGKELRRWRAADSEVLGLQFTPDGRGLLSCSRDKLVLWDQAAGKELREFVGHGRSLRAMALSADGRRLAAGGHSGSIHLWDVPTGSLVLPIEGHRAAVAAVRFSPDGKRLASAGGDRLLLWDVGGRRRVAAFGDYGDRWSDARFAPGRPVLLGLDRDKGVRFWDLRTEREVRRVGGGREGVLQFDQSPDGRLV
jgi:WD40 repeat protein